MNIVDALEIGRLVADFRRLLQGRSDGDLQGPGSEPLRHKKARMYRASKCGLWQVIT